MPRPKMPEGLYVSVSQLRCWLRCPMAFELKYIRGTPPAFVPLNLAFGSAIHEALAAYYGEIKNSGSPLRLDLVLDVFRAAWEKAVDGEVPLQVAEDGDDPGLVIDKGISLLHAFYANATNGGMPETVEEVEMGFVVDLHDPDSGEILDEKLVGTIDLIVREAGRRVIYEHKTSSKKYTKDQLDTDFQVTAYRCAARQVGMGEVGLKFQVLVKTKVPTIQVAEVSRGAQDEDDFLRTAGGVLKAIDAGVSYPIRGWACRGCQFAYACRGASS